MILSEEAISLLKAKSELKAAVCEELELKDKKLGMWRLINQNTNNGQLTKYAVIRLIKNHSTLEIEQIIIDQPQVEPVESVAAEDEN